jgi:hypothetical protein
MSDDLPVRHGSDHLAARISDRDRDETVARLRQASGDGVLDLDEFADRVELVYRARTRDDLELLERDLPEPPPESVVEADAERRADRWAVAVASSQRRRGPWRPAPTTRAVSVFGMNRLDLTEVALPRRTEIRATVAFGGVDVVVPDGVRVEMGGWLFCGSTDYRVRPSRGAMSGDAPVVSVRARGMFGGVAVRSRPQRVP